MKKEAFLVKNGPFSEIKNEIIILYPARSEKAYPLPQVLN
jgi:hypothetical protein